MKIKIIICITLVIGTLFLISVQKETVAEIKMTTINGDQISTNNLLGKVFLINFWATDCPGCIKEMPGLVETYNKFKDKNFELLAVAMHYDPPSRVLSYSKNNSLPFPVIIDVKKDIIKNFENVKLTPTSILIDHEGRIVNTIIGEIEFEKFNKTLEILLEKANQHS